MTTHQPNNPQPRPSWRKWALRLIGVALLAFIVYRIGSRSLLRHLKDADWRWVAAAGVLCAGSFVAKAVRWRAILALSGIYVRLWPATRAYMGAALLGLLTPGRIGEVSKAAAVRGWSPETSWGRALGTVVLDRLTDIAAFVAAGAWGLAWVGLPGEYRVVGEVGIIVLMALGFLGALASWRMITHTDLWRLARDWSARKIGAGVSDFYQTLRLLRPPTILPIAGLTLLAYLLFFGFFILLARAFGSELPWRVLCWGISLASLAALLPISISGIGTRDFVLLAIFQTWGEEPGRVLAISLTYLAGLYVVVGLLGGSAFITGEWNSRAMPPEPER